MSPSPPFETVSYQNDIRWLQWKAFIPLFVPIVVSPSPPQASEYLVGISRHNVAILAQINCASVLQFVPRVSGWHVRGASAAVAACTGLPKATDGSASTVPNSAASHASDGGGICVINVCREAILLLRDRIRRKLMSLNWSHQRRIHRAINGCRVKRTTHST